MEEIRLAKAKMVSAASASRFRASSTLLMCSIGFACLSRSPNFEIKAWLIDTKITYSYITVFGLFAIPVLGYLLLKASNKERELRIAFYKEYAEVPDFESALAGTSESNWKSKSLLFFPFFISIIAVGAMMHQFYRLSAQREQSFLAWEVRFDDGAVAYEPWFSGFYLIGLYLLIRWAYQEFSQRVENRVSTLGKVNESHAPEGNNECESTQKE